MSSPTKIDESSASRRAFLKQTGAALTGAALASAISTRAYAGEDNTLKIALVGCGNRGSGAVVQALKTKGPTKLWAMADVFPTRIKTSLKAIGKLLPKEQLDVPAQRQFIGMDGYRKAIDAIGPNGVVLLTTPPAFRPMHLEYAVEKGCHAFIEKSMGVDPPGVHRLWCAGEKATQKNLKIAGGLMSRHSSRLEQAVQRIHDGMIGEVITVWAYRELETVKYLPRDPGESEMAHQIRNYSNFTWLNGTFLLDWLIHNLDISCWVKGAWPVSAQGQGGRQVRQEPDQLFDHYAVEYSFDDGTRLFAQGRGMSGCFDFWGCVVHGTKGSAVLGEGITHPRIYKGYKPRRENILWQCEQTPYDWFQPYQHEHDLFFDAIRNDKPYNETERSGMATMVGILGRMASESGKEITMEQAKATTAELAPGLDRFTMASTPPALPDAQGHYPIAMPGISKPI